MGTFEEDDLLEKLRAKLGAPRKQDERQELERIFGSMKEAPETKLRNKMKKPLLDVGAEFNVTILKLAFGGRGFGRHESIGVFVPGAVPGDTVRVRITKVDKDTYHAEPIELIAPSSNRIHARCPFFGRCGGCSLQNLTYTAQLTAKQEMIKDVLHSIGGIDFQIRNPIASPDPYGYRLTARLHVHHHDGTVLIGFNAANTNQIVPIDQCPVLVPVLQKLLPVLPEILPEPGTNVIPNEIRLHADSEQNAVVIHLVADQPILYLDSLLRTCRNRSLPVSGISAESPEWRNSTGETTVRHTIGKVTYRVEGGSFFQANRYLLQALQNQAIMLLSPGPRDTLLDLYCGCGLFTLPMSRYLAGAVGLDCDIPAILAAKESLHENELDKVVFAAVEDRNFFKNETVAGTGFSILITDPPRSGMPSEVLKKIIELKPAKLLYVSCNPPHLARDLKQLIEAEFRIRIIQPLDLFPQTHHIEVLAFLTHRYTGPQAASASLPDLD